MRSNPAESTVRECSKRGGERASASLHDLMSVASERRDLAAREARDRLAGTLGVHPRRLGGLDIEMANLIAFRLEQALEAAELASHDELTGVYARAHGRAICVREIERSARSGEKLSMLFIDFDGLKQVNDEHGHSIGDLLLARLGETLADTLRPYDTAVRWGGDEFLVVLPDCDLAQAQRIAERLASDFEVSTHHSVTWGAAELMSSDNFGALVARADAAMYQVKRARRASRERDWNGPLDRRSTTAHGSEPGGG